MHTSETTNGLIERAVSTVKILIQWAEADAEHARENDATGTSKDDLRRAKALRKALALIEDCRR